MKPKSFEELFEQAKQRDEYWVADAIYTFTEELHDLAEVNKVSRVELASRLGTSPAYITKVFRGNTNFTIDTMVRLSRAVGGKLHLHVAPEEHAVRWLDIRITKKKAIPPSVDQFKKFQPGKLKEDQDERPLAA
jgi:transcriptional regulator with XRE-family HTH domain